MRYKLIYNEKKSKYEIKDTALSLISDNYDDFESICKLLNYQDEVIKTLENRNGLPPFDEFHRFVYCIDSEDNMYKIVDSTDMQLYSLKDCCNLLNYLYLKMIKYDNKLKKYKCKKLKIKI